MASATPGAAAAVSSVKLKLVAADTLPATSVWRTWTVFAPSAALKLLLQCAPLSMLYCTVAPLSTPLRLSTPELVTRSLALVPESIASATAGAPPAAVSIVKVNVAAEETFPATSICLTCTSFTPSAAALKLLLQ
ncbi:hypothetical protein LMG27174_07180 [Paraburkholderia rhynchosiae]|uniref:Uncharacterized protein n=1 Tax=Paraburkholderia rhynchosiae TaxID=487049 RepID=A0A6J5CWT7_9BURK|nr:hypothetical protein LMG27174_07180 [Paraburkholderia rhynchosiae]